MNINQAIDKNLNPKPKLTNWYYKEPKIGQPLDRALTDKELVDFTYLMNNGLESVTITQFLVYRQLTLTQRKALHKKDLSDKELEPLSLATKYSIREIRQNPGTVKTLADIFKQIDRVLSKRK